MYLLSVNYSKKSSLRMYNFDMSLSFLSFIESNSFKVIFEARFLTNFSLMQLKSIGKLTISLIFMQIKVAVSSISFWIFRKSDDI